MKKFFPYFKLLLPVKGRFTIAIVAGVIYGIASGFGLPFMTAKVFPLLFASDQNGIQFYIKETALKGGFHEVNNLKEFPVSQNLLIKVNPSSEYSSLPSDAIFTTNGEILQNGTPLDYASLFYKSDEGEIKQVDPAIYLRKGDDKYQKVSTAEFDQNNTPLLLSVLLLPAIFLVRGIAGYINTYCITYCGQFVLERIRTDVFKKFQRLDLGFFQKNGTGDLMTRLMVQTTRLQQMLTSASNDLIKQPITFLGAMGGLIYLSIQHKSALFLLVCLGIIPLCIIPVRRFSKMMLKKMREGAVGENKIGNCLQENIVGARDIRSYNLENLEIEKFSSKQNQFFKFMLGMTKYRALVNPSVEVITTIGVSLAIYLSARHGMTLEVVIPLIVALYMSYEPIKRISVLQSQLALGTVAIEMLDGILKTEEKVKDPVQPKPLPPLKGGITFQNVMFRYDTGPPVLRGINSSIIAGEVVALVGPSGAGKSTFTHLISRTYEITRGKVFFDQNDVTEHKLSDIRANVAVVSQDPYLFNDTVKNNIRLGKLEATDEEILVAAERANCTEFISKLPKGMDTICGEKATLLSGGQRQRLAIARAFLKDSPILILDEATSALDAESEQTVQAALAKLVKGRTTLLIAHRFSSIQIATRILVFNNGQIVADGTHESLLKSSSLYKELYLKQNI